MQLLWLWLLVWVCVVFFSCRAWAVLVQGCHQTAASAGAGALGQGSLSLLTGQCSLVQALLWQESVCIRGCGSVPACWQELLGMLLAVL